MLLHKEVREPKLPVTGTGQSGKLIGVMLMRSVRTARRTDETCSKSLQLVSLAQRNGIKKIILLISKSKGHLVDFVLVELPRAPAL